MWGKGLCGVMGTQHSLKKVEVQRAGAKKGAIPWGFNE